MTTQRGYSVKDDLDRITGVFTPTPRWNYWSQPRDKRVAGDTHIGITGSVSA